MQVKNQVFDSRLSHPCDNGQYGIIYLTDEVSFPSVGLKWGSSPGVQVVCRWQLAPGFTLSTTVCPS